MRMIKYAAGIAAAAMLAAQPAAAADDFRERRGAETRTGAFAGFSLRVPMGEGRTERPRARLQLTTTASVREAGGATTTRYAPGIELGSSRRHGVALSIGGTDVRQVDQRLGLSGSRTTTILIVGGVVLAVLVLRAVVRAQPTPGPGDGTFD